MGCNSLPEPTLINVADYMPATPSTENPFSLPLSDTDSWEAVGWNQSPENEMEGWSSSSGTARSLFSHADIRLHLEVKLTQTSSLEIRLQNEFPFVLHGNKSRKGHEAIAGISPGKITGRKPGLWQTLDLHFAAPVEGVSPARLVQASLNGATIHDQTTLPESMTQGPGRLVIQAEGDVSIRNVTVQRLGQEGNSRGQAKTSLLIPNPKVTYQYFEKDNWTLLSGFTSLTPLSSGETELIDIAQHSQRAEHYGLKYSGSFTVPQAARYAFNLTSDDGSSLSIDGETIVLNDSSHAPRMVSASVDLEAGEHQAVIHFFQGGGGASLRLDYTAEGLDLVPLFSPAPGAPASNQSDYYLSPEEEPIVQRGFLIYPPRQKLKRGESPDRITQGISIGSPTGYHCAVDAGTGTLLMLWEGEFADMSNMWEGRGEWQNLQPMGDLIDRRGAPDFAVLSSINSPWPDSASTIETRGYSLDKKGWPTFEYQLAESTIQDQITATDQGVTRTISVSDNSATIYQLLATGESIDNLGEGLFAIQGPGYLTKIRSCDGCELFLRQTTNGQELISAIKPGGGNITTSFIW